MRKSISCLRRANGNENDMCVMVRVDQAHKGNTIMALRLMPTLMLKQQISEVMRYLKLFSVNPPVKSKG